MWETKKQEGIIVLAMLRVWDIPDSNVLVCHDGKDIAFVASIETTHPKYGPFTLPSSEWP
jgi:hypothetical protein